MTSTDDARTATAGRALGLVTAAIGAVTLFRATATAAAAGRPDAPPDPRIVRVLGARQLVQGLVTAAVPTSDVLLLGAGVDAAHAASMLPLLVSRFRRPALTSAAVAAGSAVLAVRLARRP